LSVIVTLQSATRAFRRDCGILRELIARPDAERLRQLEWYGMSLGRLLSDDALIEEIIAESATAPASSHGFGRLYHRERALPDGVESAPTVWHLPGLTSAPWHDSDTARRLEASAPDIIAEFQAWRAELAPHPDSAEVVRSGSWRSLFLIGAGGTRATDIAHGFPRTLALIDTLDICRNFGFVFFAKTVAGTAMARHAGSANLRLRHQLCLELGADTLAHIEVGNERRSWRVGRCLAFDDSFPHELHHVAGAPRVVLAVDTWHPSLTVPEKAALSHEVFGRFGKVA
jgi:hypothetical protein